MGVNEQETPVSGCYKWIQCYQAKTGCDLYRECRVTVFCIGAWYSGKWVTQRLGGKGRLVSIYKEPFKLKLRVFI